MEAEDGQGVGTRVQPVTTLGGVRHLKGLLGLVVLAGAALPLSAGAGPKQSAQEVYRRAVNLREALESQPDHTHTRADFDKVIRAFQAVFRTDPACVKTPASLAAVAELYREMGREFSADEDYRAAIKAYEFLAAQYPASSLARDALLSVGEIYNQDLSSPADARESYEKFLKQYPRSAKAAAAQQAIKRIDDAEKERAAQATSRQPLAEGPHSGQLLQVTGVHHWAGPDYSRVVIGVEDEVQFSYQRVANPDRLVLDLSNTRVGSALVGKSYAVDDGFLRQIRLGQNKPTVTRVVLDVERMDDYSVSTLPNPFRLVVDIHGKPKAGNALTSVAPQTSAAAAARGALSAAPDLGAVPAAREAGAATGSSRSSLSTSPDLHTLNPEAATANHSGPSASAAPMEAGATESTGTFASSGGKANLAASGPANKTTAAASAPADSSQPAVITAPNTARTQQFPAKPPAPTEAGSRTLTRALGLKINRIVIDAGHGGHDTGTIGPTGLCEKDLVLDVAFRLKKLVETRMGSEVIMTRSDDTFIPLGERTAIANEKDADLFISIHANASRDRSARGIETYYLNFTSSPDALEVAARENATSQESIHQLQQLIEKIALTEKIEESRELARQVQRSVYAQIARSAAQERDRGLKKAPFVVLIGANMPSILSEISFLTNPRDESLLKKSSYRQKIAEALYRGIARYVNNLSGIKVAQETTPALGEPSHSARRMKSSSVSAPPPATKPVF